MKVAVFGSWSDAQADKDWGFMSSRNVFNDACRAIGNALAHRGHTLIVESADQDVADPHVVQGYVEYPGMGASSELKIELAWPRGHARPFEHFAQVHPGLFIHHPLPAPETERQRWKNSHLVSLKHADAILTIGGKEGTYLAGSAAIVAHKPLVPIASFGGASTRLLSDLQANSDDHFDAAYYDLNGPWSPYVLERAVGLFEGSTSKTKIFISHAHVDEDLAQALVEVITKAFEISADAIRCTSVSGFKLFPGDHTASQLRGEIEKTEFVLGIITPRSIESKYVLLELGAAWGLKKRIFPLVARGVKTSSVPGPLGELHWINLAASPDCYHLLDAFSSFKPMGDRRKHGSGALVAKAVDQLVAYAQAETKQP